MASDSGYHHHAEHDNIHSDPGPIYQMEWVQDLLRHIQTVLRNNSPWLGIDDSKPQRVLDYACGNGIVSRTLASQYPNATFHGLDIAISQVERYNDEASKTPNASRMKALQGDITDPSNDIKGEEWFGFDVAIISMALHHVKNPIEFLALLKQRVRVGGTVVVLDWLIPPSNHLSDIAKKYDIENMGTVPGAKLKIWPGFSEADMHQDMREAGCADVDVIAYPEKIVVPQNMGGLMKLFIAKAHVV